MGLRRASGPIDHLQHCWFQGIGLRHSITCVARTCGVTMDFEEARRHFVRWADRFLGGAE